jgi:carbon monoxide dehydrogenase subunit G
MIVEGSHTFPGPREVVWKMLLDPDVLAKTMPGASTITRVADDRYEGKMKVGVGPITAAEFEVTITLSDPVPPERYRMTIEGRGRFGFTRGNAAVTLATDGAGTAMHYQADLQIGGKIAAVGQRLLDTVSKMMLRQGLEAMTREMERRLAEGTA